MSLFSSSKSVLLLNDDGVSVYYARTSGVEYIDNVIWGDADFQTKLSKLISGPCSSSPVIFINDMVEQHYRKERVARASLLDRANLIKRRVAGVFPSYALRAALKLKEKAPMVEGQRAGDIYLFAAMSMTEGVGKAIAAVQSAKSSIAGFCLLPVEATSTVHSLSKKLSRVGFGGTEWTIFAGQHSGGGLRQVVTKNGELALTRLTPVPSYEASGVESWCHDVASELRGTMGYLSRFGFSPNDTLTVVVIGDSDASSRLSSKIDFDCDLNVLSINEAADMLGLRLGARKGLQSDSHLAEILHIAAISKKKSFILNLENSKIENLNKPIRAVQLVIFSLCAAAIFFAYQGFTKIASILSTSSQIEITNQELASLTQQRDAEVERKKQIGLDFVLVERVTTAFESLKMETMLPLPALEKIGMALGSDLHVKTVTVKPTIINPALVGNNVDPAQNNAIDDAPKPKSFDLVLTFVFPTSLQPEAGVQKIAELETRLKENLPDSDVTIIKQVADLSYTGNFVGQASSSTASVPQGQSAPYEAQIMIRGPLQ